MSSSISAVHDTQSGYSLGGAFSFAFDLPTPFASSVSNQFEDFSPAPRFSQAILSGTFGNGEALPSGLLVSDGSVLSTIRVSTGDTIEWRIFGGMLQFLTSGSTGVASVQLDFS